MFRTVTIAEDKVCNIASRNKRFKILFNDTHLRIQFPSCTKLHIGIICSMDIGCVVVREFRSCIYRVIYEADSIRSGEIVCGYNIVNNHSLTGVNIEIQSSCTIHIESFVCIIVLYSYCMSVGDDESRL